MKAGRYKLGEANRQAIIDHLLDHPGDMAIDIIRALGIHRQSGSSRLAKMADRGELRREKAVWRGINALGEEYSTSTYAYWANVDKTRSQADVCSSIAANVNKKEPVEDKTAQRWIGGSYRNVSNDRPVTICPDVMKGVGYRGMTQLEAVV